MRAPVSVIIPVYNGEKQLTTCLKSLMKGMQDEIIREVIVVDGGSTDNSIVTAFNWGARVICSAAKGRGRQLRTGAKNATGEWFLFLHADTKLDKNWPRMVDRHMFEHETHAAAFELRYQSNSKEARWLEKRANQRAKLLGLPYGDQGLLMPRAMYEDLGGFKDMPLMEDVDMVRRIRKRRLKILPVRAFTSAEKYERDGWRKRAYSNALLLTRYYLGASPEKLSKLYK